MAQLHLGNNVNISTYYGNNTGQSVYVFTKSNQNKIKGIYQDIDQAITNIRNDEAIELSVPRMFSTIDDAVVYITSNSYANCNFLVSVKQGTYTIGGQYRIEPNHAKSVKIDIEDGSRIEFEEHSYLILNTPNSEIFPKNDVILVKNENSSQPIIKVINKERPSEVVPSIKSIIGLFDDLNIAFAGFSAKAGREISLQAGEYPLANNPPFLKDVSISGVLGQTYTTSSVIQFGPDVSFPVEFSNTEGAVIQNIIFTFNRDVNIPDAAFLGFGSESQPVIANTAFRNCIFVNVNSKPGQRKMGTALRVGYASGNFSIQNCLFKNFNTALRFDSPSSATCAPVISGTIFDGNVVGVRCPEGLNLFTRTSYNDFFNNNICLKIGDGESYTTITAVNSVSAGNNISSDPQYIDASLLSFRLSTGSVLIDAMPGLVDIGPYDHLLIYSVVFIVKKAISSVSDFLKRTLGIFGSGGYVEFTDQSAVNNSFTANTFNPDEAEISTKIGEGLEPIIEVKISPYFHIERIETSIENQSIFTDPGISPDKVISTFFFNGKELPDLQIKYSDIPVYNTTSEIKIGHPDQTPPNAPINFQAGIQNNAILLGWDISPEEDIMRYKVFKSSVSPIDLFPEYQIASVDRNTNTFSDGSGVSGCFAIVAYDSSGNQSAATETIGLVNTTFSSIGSAGSYSTGTISVSHNSFTVFGNGTAWSSANRGKGDIIVINGTSYSIFKVESNERLFLATNYSGQSISNNLYTINRKYSTLQAWASTHRDLVAAQQSEVAVLYNDGVEFTVNWQSHIDDGWKTDSLYRLTITANERNRQKGRENTGVVINCQGSVWNLYKGWTTLENVEVKNSSNCGLYLAGTHNIVRNCLFHNGTQYGIHVYYDARYDSVYNNIVYGFDSTGISIASNQWNLIANNTVYGCNEGIRCSHGNYAYNNMFVVNNISVKNSVDYKEVPGSIGFNANDSNNIAGDGSLVTVGAGPNSKNNITANQIAFVDTATATKDLHIKYSSVAINTGADLSSLFRKDMDDTLRPQSNAWDIGADEFSGEIPELSPIRYVSVGPRADYSEGSISATSGAKAVTGTGTQWLDNNRGRGDSIIINGLGNTIDSVTSNTRIVLTTPAGVTYSGNSYAIKRKYPTLQAWASTHRDLVAADLCEAAYLFNDNAEFVVNWQSHIDDGWHTDSLHRLTITADERNQHRGKENTGVVVNCQGSVWNLYKGWTILENLEVKNSSNYGLYLAGRNNVVRNCLFHGGSSHGIHVYYDGKNDSVYNNIVYGFDSAGIDIATNQWNLIANNTAYGCHEGIRCSHGNYAWNNMYVVNNISMGNGADFSEVPGSIGFNENDTSNICGDNSLNVIGIGSKNHSSITYTQIAFTDTATTTRDLHIQAGSIARNAGADLGCYFVTDIDGGVRVQWDIGADGYGIGMAKRAREQQAPKEEYPKVFALHQNMPNPFNPTTIIWYDIPYREGGQNSHFTRLEIFNIRGQLVRTLVNEIKKPGYHSVIWDGKSDNGRTLASGLYIYRIIADDFIQKRRMLLVK